MKKYKIKLFVQTLRRPSVFNVSVHTMFIIRFIARFTAGYHQFQANSFCHYDRCSQLGFAKERLITNGNKWNTKYKFRNSMNKETYIREIGPDIL
jgi:hypothetical protein